MAINRAPFDALIDDPGGGTTGTPWNKTQIAAVILDPTDAAIPNLSAVGQYITFNGDYGLARSGAATGKIALHGAGAGTGGVIAIYGNLNGTNPGGTDVYFGSGGSVYRLKTSSDSTLLLVDGNGVTQFTSSTDVAWTFNSTHSNGAVIRTTNNGSQNMFLGARAATGTGSASDAVFGCQGNLYLWPQAGYLVPHNDGATGLGSSSNKWVELWATNGTIQTSDARHKTDIGASTCGLAFITQLRPVRYRWREGETARVHHGLIAQDLLNLGADEFVYGSEAEGYGTNYASFIAPLIVAIQQLAARLEALEQRM